MIEVHFFSDVNMIKLKNKLKLKKEATNHSWTISPIPSRQTVTVSLRFYFDKSAIYTISLGKREIIGLIFKLDFGLVWFQLAIGLVV